MLDSDSQKSIDWLDEGCDCQSLVTAIVGQDEADILVEGQQNSTGYLLEGELTWELLTFTVWQRWNESAKQS